MKHNKHDLEAIIDKATQAIREEQIDPAIVDAAADRVWARVSQSAEDFLVVKQRQEGINTMNTSNNAEHIRGCDDFRSLMPAYLEGKLSTGRKLLLEDHSNECIPCRQELKVRRNLAAAQSPTYISPYHAGSSHRASAKSGARRISNTSIARWSIAAALVLCVGLAGMFMYERLDLSGTTLAATVESSNGQIFVVTDHDTREIAVGEEMKKGEIVRTAKDSNALLRLADGSTVEMSERSEFSISENMRGVTVKLDRGDMIVEAAEQHNGRLFVQTPDSLVSVKGTIFAVESGIKGSRVSVVEGEVQVKHGNKNETLLPGQQTTTKPGLDKSPVAKNVAWSRNAARYANLVSELTRLRKEVEQKAARPGVRHTSRFIDLIPENTVFFAALPNLSATLAESQRIMQERIRQNPALSQWWKGNRDGIDSGMMSRIHEFGSQLGDEIVVTAEMNAQGEPSGILVLGEVKNGANFRAFVDGQMASMSKRSGDMPSVRFVDDPLTAVVAASKQTDTAEGGNKTQPEIFVWIQTDIFAAAPRIESLRGFAATLNAKQTNRTSDSSFHQRIADVYDDGAGLVIAADLEKIVSKAVASGHTADDQRHVEGLKQLGVMNLRHFVAEQKEVNGKTLSRAALTFSEADRGIASWLAAPGSMGALDFVSSSANVAAAFVVKDPALLVDDLLGFFETVRPEVRQQLAEIERTQGLSLRNDFAAPLGGEFAFAIDGPILPTPSWKVILEVYDQARLQNTFERAIEKLNQFAVLHGKGKLGIASETSGDRTFYAIRSADTGLEVHYTYANGYLIAAPTRALLEQAIWNRDAGNTLVRSARFLSSLPQDGRTAFSAVFYHDLAALMGPLAEKVKNSPEAQKIGEIDADAAPTLAYVYAEGDRITLAANTEGGPFGLSPASLIGMPNSFEMQHILSNALGDKDVQKKE